MPITLDLLLLAGTSQLNNSRLISPTYLIGKSVIAIHSCYHDHSF